MEVPTPPNIVTAKHKREPIVAGLLSFFVAGLGQLYAGNLLRGVIAFVLYSALVLLSCLLLAKLPFGLILLLQILLAGTLGSALTAWDAYRQAKRVGPNFAPKFYNKWYVYLLIALVVLFANPLFYLARMIIGAVSMPTASMSETIVPGEHLVIDNLAYNLHEPNSQKVIVSFGLPQRGDVIVFEAPHEPGVMYAQRVVGLPGDKLALKGNQLWLNDNPVTEQYAKYDTTEQPLEDFGPQIVPADKVFVMGDNRNQSYDSRFFGGVPLANVKAKVKGIYWSQDVASGQIRGERIGQSLR